MIGRIELDDSVGGDGLVEFSIALRRDVGIAGVKAITASRLPTIS